MQRYEGASTIYGPHTLSAYVQHFRGLAKAIAEARTYQYSKKVFWLTKRVLWYKPHTVYSVLNHAIKTTKQVKQEVQLSQLDSIQQSEFYLSRREKTQDMLKGQFYVGFLRVPWLIFIQPYKNMAVGGLPAAFARCPAMAWHLILDVFLPNGC